MRPVAVDGDGLGECEQDAGHEVGQRARRRVIVKIGTMMDRYLAVVSVSYWIHSRRERRGSLLDAP